MVSVGQGGVGEGVVFSLLNIYHWTDMTKSNTPGT